MKFGIQVISIIISAFIIELFLPWWSIALASFTCGVVWKSNANFLAGFLAIVLLWLTKAIVIDLNAATPLAEKVAAIFQLNSKTLIFTVMAMIGGLVGGFACLTGSLMRRV